MSKTAKVMSVVALTAALTAGLASAGRPANAPAQAVNQAGPVNVTFWGDWGGEGQRQFTVMADAFNASQTKIKVTYVLVQDMITKFLTAQASGTSPDIMFWDRWRTALYAPKGVLQPINDFMTRDKVRSADFFQQALKELSWKNNVYGLPLTVDARALFYNKKMLAAAGVKPPTNWDELEQAAIKLTKRDASGKLQVAGLALDDVGLFGMYLQQAGGHIVTTDGSKTAFNSPAGAKVLAYWDRLLNKDKVYEIGFGSGVQNAQDPFVTGKIAMMYTGPWNISTYKKYGKDLDFGIVPPPAGPTGARGSVMGGFGLVIPVAAKNKDAAWEFEKWWLAQPRNAIMWAKMSDNIPGNLKAIGDPAFQKDPFWKPIIDTLGFAKIRPPFSGYAVMETDALTPNLQLFVEGKQDAKTTLKKAQESGDRVLKDNNQ